MEPGEYVTNVLSSNNYGTIQYEYFEIQSPFSGSARKQLQKVEVRWRQDGILVHCDPLREGIWTFEPAQLATNQFHTSRSPTHSASAIIELKGIELLAKEKGSYQPASLARNKNVTTSSLSASSISSSPSSSLESTFRNAQAFNSRSVQTNLTQSIGGLPPPGIKSATLPTEAWPSLKHIHESFISAVLGSVVYFLCRDYNFVPLNSRTLILTTPVIKPPSIMAGIGLLEATSVTLATLDISLTSLGSLVVKGYSDTAPGLQRVINTSAPDDESSKLLSGATLWLAPGGNAAKFYRSEDNKQLSPNLLISELQADTTRGRQHCYMGVTIQSWKSKCLEWLSAKGLNANALEDGGWIFVQILHAPTYLNVDYPNSILEDLTVVPWPTFLCFQTASTDTHLEPVPLNHDTRDPLSFAEEWFTTKDERANLLVKRQKERQAMEAKSKEQAEVNTRATQPTMYSPAALRRGSNAGAMYPTPPDVIHHPVGATPSFDCGPSTPGNPNTLFAPDFEPGQQSLNPGSSTSQSDIWTSAGKQERTNANVNFNENDNDNTNLFEDGGGYLYAPIITEDDFDFFDQPGDMHVDHQIGSPKNAVPDDAKDTLVMGMPCGELPGKPDVDMLDYDKVNPMKEDMAVIEDKIEQSVGYNEGSQAATTEPAREVIQPKLSPPFDMQAVFKRLIQEPLKEKKPPASRKSSVFSKIDFEKDVTSVDQKYATKGRFHFSDQAKNLPPIAPLSLPTTEYLSRRRKAANHEQDLRSLAWVFQEDSEVINIPEDEDQTMLFLVDSDLGSQMSEQDDTSHTTDDYSMAYKPGMKRKWTMDNDGGDDVTSSFNALAVEYANSVGTPLSISGSQLPLLEGDPADWSLTTYFTSLEPELQSNALSDQDCIATAQILADQAVSGTIKVPGTVGRIGDAAQVSTLNTSSTSDLMHTIMKITKSCIAEIARCTMLSFLEIQGIPALNQALRLPPRPNPRSVQDLDACKSNNLYPIPPPRLEVRRSDTKLTVMPSAVKFWENLGLGPSAGSKDVCAVCVYPNIDGVAENSSYFLDQMRNIYESSRLGSHNRAVAKHLENGLISYTVDPACQTNKAHLLAILKETTARLSRSLSSLAVEEKNLVVYFVYPTDNAALLVHICTAFQHLFTLYKRALSEKKAIVVNELVLQLVPLDLISSPTSIVVPSPPEHSRLAMEVYGRCMDFASHSSDPAILLEQPLPRNIELKLNATPSASLLQENSCLHIAYAQSIDDRWITAAWTNNRGTHQMTASYCLGRKNEPLSMPFSEVANEIWETTLDIISKKKIHWRVMITRVGVMDPTESDFWTGLAATESSAQVSLTLITVQTDPSLRLLPQSVTLLPNSTSTQSANTPVSTPQTMQAPVLSPDTPARENASVATPGDNPTEPDSDARLLDYTDQCWGAVLSHRLNNSNSLLEINPALISGYLVKRGGTNSDDPPIVMEVNIVHCELVGHLRPLHDGLLKEILGYYRALGTLARVRGVVDPVTDIRPWHIAAAEKAVKALYMLM